MSSKRPSKDSKMGMMFVGGEKKEMPLRLEEVSALDYVYAGGVGGHGCWNEEMIVKWILSDKGEEEEQSQMDG